LEQSVLGAAKDNSRSAEMKKVSMGVSFGR
jgi:hypothetical protein